ncbi:MAG: MFS transporter [Psychroflexus maritimus]
MKKGNKKLIFAWAFYDWANSVYSLVITSAIFPLFYGALTIVKDEEGNMISDQVDFLGMSFNNDALISYTTALAFICIVILSPLLSGIADFNGKKKSFMKFFNYLGVAGCIGLYWFNLEFLWLGLLFYLFGLIGFWGSIVFYNSYLPDIANKDQQDQASAKGFALGYIGSVILLIICLIMILNYAAFGFESESTPTRISFILTGIWWLGFSQYTYFYLPYLEPKKNNSGSLIYSGYEEVKKVFLKIKDNPQFYRYLIAFFVYSMAVQTIMLVATYFGVKEIKWGETDATKGLITSILLIQLVAIVGAFLAAKLAKKYSNIWVLIGINIIWVFICFYAFLIESPIQFYITAFFVGLVMGGIQSLSRSTYSKMIPKKEKDTTSFFSFFDVTEKLGIIIGMLLYGSIAQITGNVRNAIIFLSLIFICGIILLMRVPKKNDI